MNAAQEYYEERAAIREHDGDQPKAEAEQAAADELVNAPNIDADEKVPVLMHEPITHTQKVDGLAKLMVSLRRRGARIQMAQRLEKHHGRDIAQEIVDEARAMISKRRSRR